MAEYTSTSNQGWTIPDDDNSYLKSVPDYMLALAEDIEKQAVMRFANSTEFSSKVPTPEEGMVYYLTDDKELYIYADSASHRLWPPEPKISYGTAAPTGAGESGEIYFEIGS